MQLHFSISNGNVVAQLYNEEHKVVCVQQCEIQNLCEKIVQLFARIDEFLTKNKQIMPFDERNICFDFDEQKNITTARIILSFIAGLNILNIQNK